MPFSLHLTPEANRQLEMLGKTKAHAIQFKAVCKCLRLLASQPRHPGLNTHTSLSIQGPEGEKVFEAYAENHTPGAYRVFWHYGPGKKDLTVLAITPHP